MPREEDSIERPFPSDSTICGRVISPSSGTVTALIGSLLGFRISDGAALPLLLSPIPYE